MKLRASGEGGISASPLARKLQKLPQGWPAEVESPVSQDSCSIDTEVRMKSRGSSLVRACGVVSFVAASVLVAALPHTAFAQIAEDGGDMKDRVAIQEKLLYAYAYAYDSKDCVSWANLFTADAILDLGTNKATGRDAILRFCVARQKDVVGTIKTRHNMTNIVFDQLTSHHAQTRTYVVLTWQKPGDRTPSTQFAGTYRDVIVKQDDGRWLFKERHLDR
jgi:SnoaL-like protein